MNDEQWWGRYAKLFNSRFEAEAAIAAAWLPHANAVHALFLAAGGRDGDRLSVTLDTATLVIDGVETLTAVRRLFEAGAAS